jgi:hypothetical protein
MPLTLCIYPALIISAVEAVKKLLNLIVLVAKCSLQNVNQVSQSFGVNHAPLQAPRVPQFVTAGGS